MSQLNQQQTHQNNIDSDIVRIDVGVLKNQITSIIVLCDKMDSLIDKIITQHDRHTEKIYMDMESRRREADKKIDELNHRVDAVSGKVTDSEIRIIKQISDLREEIKKEITIHYLEQNKTLHRLNNWKWMVVGEQTILAAALRLGPVHRDIGGAHQRFDR